MKKDVTLRLAALCAAAAFSFDAHAGEQTFEQAFSVKGEPAATHFKATFVANGAEHQLEVWRDANRIRRATDDSAESYAVRRPGGAGYSLALLDLKRKIRTDIDRDNLYRIGNFTDWFDLGHGLRHPKGRYRLTAARAAPGAPAAIAPCGWVDLVQDGRVTHVCWSDRNRLPLLIETGDGHIVWRVTEVDHEPIAAATFAMHDEGFVRNNANRDIEQD